MKNTILLFTLLISYWSFATDEFELPDGDEVTIEEMKMTKYEKDTSASAVILFEVVDEKFDFIDYKGGFVKRKSIRKRIKILKEQGKSEADFLFSLRKDDEFEVEAYVFNLNNEGEIEETEFDDDEIKIEKGVDGKLKIHRFSLPKVKVGSVIDIECNIIYANIGLGFDKYFQHYIPVIHSEYSFCYPEYIIYNRTIKGYERIKTLPIESKTEKIFKYNINYNSYIHKYIADSIPAFKKEKYMLSAENYISKIAYEIKSERFPHTFEKNYSQTWSSVANKLMLNNRFGEQIDETGFMDDNFLKTVEGKNSMDKIQLIYHHIKDKIKWNGNFGVQTSDDIDDIYEEKQSGNVADINLMLVAALREQGIHAYPVILSTRSNGFIYPTSPTITDFNYVVAYIKEGDMELFLDATDKYTPFGKLPFRCLNDNKMRLIGKKDSQWVTYQDKSKFTESHSYALEMDQEGNLKGTLTEKFVGYSARDFRDKYAKYSDDEELMDEIETENLGLSIEDMKIENIDDLSKPIVCKSTIEIKGTSQTFNNQIVFNPLFYERIKKSPFKLKERKYPIDFGSKIHDYSTIQIQIPDNYLVESLPKPAMIKLPGKSGRIIYQVTQLGQKINLSCIFQINTKQIAPQFYEYMKQFYKLLIKKQGENIILKKKELVKN